MIRFDLEITASKSNKEPLAYWLSYSSMTVRMTKCMHELLCRKGSGESIPDDCNLNVLCPILNLTVCVNHRRLRLLNMSYKLSSRDEYETL